MLVLPCEQEVSMDWYKGLYRDDDDDDDGDDEVTLL